MQTSASCNTAGMSPLASSSTPFLGICSLHTKSRRVTDLQKAYRKVQSPALWYNPPFPSPTLKYSPPASQPGCCSQPAGCPPPGKTVRVPTDPRFPSADPAAQEAGGLSLLRPALGLGDICPGLVWGWWATCRVISLSEPHQQPLQDLAVAGSSCLWGPATHTSTDSSMMAAARSGRPAGKAPLRQRWWHDTECQLPHRPPN